MYIFAACLFVAAAVIYFFVIKGQGRTLEEIDTMYILHVNLRETSKWITPPPEELITTERLVGGRLLGLVLILSRVMVQELERRRRDLVLLLIMKSRCNLSGLITNNWHIGNASYRYWRRL
jgi:hypothetical protein